MNPKTIFFVGLILAGSGVLSPRSLCWGVLRMALPSPILISWTAETCRAFFCKRLSLHLVSA